MKKQTTGKTGQWLTGLLLCTLTAGMAAFAASPVMAHGAEVHTAPSPVVTPDSEAFDPDASPEEPVVVPMSPMPPMALHSSENSAHSHGADDAPVGQAAEGVHDHSAHAPNNQLLETGFGRFLVWVGKLHPAAVHFPIAMLLGAALAELISMRRNTQFFQSAGRFCLWLGALSATGAALLGWFYGGFRLVDEEAILTLHRWNGTGVAGVALLALWLGEKRVRQQLSRAGGYRVALVVVALMVGLNGYLGGLMVYGPEQHQWPEAPSEHSH